MPKPISCAAYIETIFDLFHWDPKYRYRASGVRRQRGEESVLIFDLNETEILIPAESGIFPSAPSWSQTNHSCIPPVMGRQFW